MFVTVFKYLDKVMIYAKGDLMVTIEGSSMVIARAPLRGTLTGGGTDLLQYYGHYGHGAAVNFAIDQYVTIIIDRHFSGDALRVAYRKRSEDVRHIDQLQNKPVQEILRRAALPTGIEMTSEGNAPAQTGLGSSSSFSVAALHAAYAYSHIPVYPEMLAQDAVAVARSEFPNAGKQDEYAAAFGGFHLWEFESDESVKATAVNMSPKTNKDFMDSTMMFYTGEQRSSTPILKSQSANIPQHVAEYGRMAELAVQTAKELRRGDIPAIGALVGENWSIKKGLDKQISSPLLERVEELLRMEIYGMKLMGAGGQGVVLVMAPPEKRDRITELMVREGLTPLNFKIVYKGSRIVYSHSSEL